MVDHIIEKLHEPIIEILNELFVRTNNSFNISMIGSCKFSIPKRNEINGKSRSDQCEY
jgi:hypothetical protein